jgi:hypothetical protein
MIVALIALFISLGGASYAVVTLPEHSVGRRQLQPSAVTPSALGFPLGSQGFRVRTKDLVRTKCNGGIQLRPGEPAPPCSPPPRRGTYPETLGHLALRSAGNVAVTAVADLKSDGTQGSTATVGLAVWIDGDKGAPHPIDQRMLRLGGGEETRVPLQGLVRLLAGRHSVGFGTTVEYSGASSSGDVVVSAVSVTASVLPPL